MSNYTGSSEHNYSEVINNAEKFGSGATWKRLGYLAEQLWSDQKEILTAANKHMSAGDAKLDPAVKDNGILINKWRLWINVSVNPE